LSYGSRLAFDGWKMGSQVEKWGVWLTLQQRKSVWRRWYNWFWIVNLIMPKLVFLLQVVSNGDTSTHRILCSMGSERILTLLCRCLVNSG
jgi:hypothetical protein